jgi:alpha-amylase
MKICFYFQVHQPWRLQPYSFFDIGQNVNYFDEQKNGDILRKVAGKCYLPVNQLMLDLIKKHKGKFKIAYSLTGTVIEQFKKYSPQTLDSFKRLADTGCVEFLNETYHHSLSALFSKDIFCEEVLRHRELIKKEFNQEPAIFRNTELIYNNELAKIVASLGYRGILAEGADKILSWRSANYLYQSADPDLKILLRNYPLSDDIAFRFSNPHWEEYPLTAEKFSVWAHAFAGTGDIINLFMDYETFGEHQWESTGIFNFLRALPEAVLAHPDFSFCTPTEAVNTLDAISTLDAPAYYSWADTERDLTAWRGNALQEDALQAIYGLEKLVEECKDEQIQSDFYKLLTSDHFYYMCTKWHADGDVHKYFNPYQDPYRAYTNFQNVVKDLKIRLAKVHSQDIAFNSSIQMVD